MSTFSVIKQAGPEGSKVRRSTWPKGEYYTLGSDSLETNNGRPISKQEMEKGDWLINKDDLEGIGVIGPNAQKTQFAEDMHQDLKRMCDMLSIAMQKKGFSIESKPDGSDAYIVYKKGPFINVVQALMSLLEDQDII